MGNRDDPTLVIKKRTLIKWCYLREFSKYSQIISLKKYKKKIDRPLIKSDGVGTKIRNSLVWISVKAQTNRKSNSLIDD